MIWIDKHNPRIDPKFHHVEMFEGVGRSINELLMILVTGDSFIICFFISIFVGGVHFLFL